MTMIETLNQAKARADEIAAALAAATGESWRKDSSERIDALICHGDEQIIIRPQQGGRFIITGTYGHLSRHQPHSATSAPDSITVSAQRSAQQIAREITRRLLPGYRANRVSAAEHKRQADADHARQLSTSQRLAALIGGTACREYIGKFRTRFSQDHPEARGEVWPSGRIRLELDYIDERTAAEILAIVTKAPRYR